MILLALAQATSTAVAASQTDTTAPASVAPWVLAIIGAIVIALALVLVIRNMPVSTGHSIFLGAGIALLALPLISKFEWSGDKFSFELKAAAQDLTKEVSRLAEENKAIRGELVQLSNALKAATTKIDLKADATTPGIGAVSPSADVDWSKYSSPNFFDDLMIRNKSAIEGNERALDNLQSIQKKLEFQ